MNHIAIDWLRDYRHKNNLTQHKVADMVGISTQHYNFIENRRRRPSPDVAKRIASILGFPDEWYRLLETNSDCVLVAEKGENKKAVVHGGNFKEV